MTRKNSLRLSAGLIILAFAAGSAAWLSSPSTAGREIHVPLDAQTIQAAIDRARDGDTVLIADGIYSGPGNIDLDTLGKAITIRSSHGPETCALDCQQAGRAFSCHSDETERTVISGLTIRNGYAVGTGGAISCINSSPMITNCRFDNCAAFYLGGAILCSNASPMIRECLFTANFAGTWGGALSCVGGGAPLLANCELVGNAALSRGGAVYSENTGLRVSGCNFSSNYARHGGGAHLFISPSAELSNCLFRDNSAGSHGGGLFIDRSGITIANCTFWRNTAPRQGGAVNCERSKPLLINCVLWDNSAQHGPELAVTGYDWLSEMIVRYSNIRGGAAAAHVEPGSVLRWTEAMLSQDPLLITTADGRVCLSQRAAGQPADSPCLDAGQKLAELTCFPTVEGAICCGQLSTRQDGAPDAGQADLGFHYPLIGGSDPHR